MTPLSASQLPQDLLNMRHILPEWLRYLYLTLEFLFAFAVTALAAALIARLYRSWKERRQIEALKAKPIRQLTGDDVRRILKDILDSTEKSRNYRLALHRISELTKAYFEVRLKKDVEEMTAFEIKKNFPERRELGEYFMSLTRLQYRENKPEQSDFLEMYNSAVDLVRRT